MQVTVTRLVRDEGTILVFEGTVDDGRQLIRFGADHRPGYVLANAMAEFGYPVVAEVEPYQVLAAEPVCGFALANHLPPHASNTSPGCPACYVPGAYKGD